MSVWVCGCGWVGGMCVYTHVCLSEHAEFRGQFWSQLYSFLTQVSMTEITLADLVTGACWKRKDKQNLTLKSTDVATI